MEGTEVVQYHPSLSPSHVNYQISDPYQGFTLLHMIGESSWLGSLHKN